MIYFSFWCITRVIIVAKLVMLKPAKIPPVNIQSYLCDNEIKEKSNLYRPVPLTDSSMNVWDLD